MIQKPVRFGPDGALVGMLTTPSDQTPCPRACLMFNVGVNHRVGPRRINVKLAHALAAKGVSSLRFDLGGIGDSDRQETSSDLLADAALNLRAAIDLAERELGAREVVIVAMCSGVAQALCVAVEDPRVIALSLFDGFTFPERRTRISRNLRRALAVSAYPTYKGKAVYWLQRRFTRNQANAPLPGIVSTPLAPEEKLTWFSDKVRRLVDRKVDLQLLYSGSLHVSDRERDQLGPLAREPFTQALQYRFLPHVDHMVSTLRGQQIFLSVVGDWVIERCFGGSVQQLERSHSSVDSATGVLSGWAASRAPS